MGTWRSSELNQHLKGLLSEGPTQSDEGKAKASPGAQPSTQASLDALTAGCLPCFSGLCHRLASPRAPQPGQNPEGRGIFSEVYRNF